MKEIEVVLNDRGDLDFSGIDEETLGEIRSALCRIIEKALADAFSLGREVDWI